MGFRDLRLVRFLSLVQRRGLRDGMNEILTASARKRLSVPRNVIEDYGWILDLAQPATLPVPRPGPLRINWLITNVAAGGGGLFNIIRTVYLLEQWGHTNRIYMTGKVVPSKAKATEIVRKNYFAIKAEVEILTPDIPDSDALIATSWPTAYTANTIGNTVQKFYFVQDLEHLFYAPGSLYEFARQTYQFGFQGITAGPWIADVLQREFGMESSSFGFSYDREAYATTGDRRLPSGKRRVLFYARPETERRGFELGVLALSLVAKRLPDIEFVLVGFAPQSINLPFPAIFPGVLALSELGALYRSCDVALVLSHTNLSLLPLELMACGCAIVSNEGPNTEWLLTSQRAQIAMANPQSLANAVIELLENNSLRREKVNAGLAFAETTDWTREIRTIESAILQRIAAPIHRRQHA
jgi:glycosyltransferase involved in cell wall biosynthesis